MTISQVADEATVPCLTPSTELLGEFEGGGLSEPVFLARRPDGTVAQLSHLLYLVLSSVDGRRTLDDVANKVSLEFGRRLDASDVAYVIANKLAPIGLVSVGEDAGELPPAPRPLTALTVRGAVLPPRLVGFFAWLLSPLFAFPVAVAFLGGVLAVDAWVFIIHGVQFSEAMRQAFFGVGSLLTLYGLLLFSMLFHEFGHAAAIRSAGGKPGPIGVGLYLIWPAFYTDVTDSYRLSRAARIRTDLGGIYFNVVFIVAMSGLFALTGSEPLLVVIVLQHFLIAVQLLPLLRLDGYYLLTDALGIPDLFARVKPILSSALPGRPMHPRAADLRPWARVTTSVWIVITLTLWVVGLVASVWRLPAMARLIDESARFHVALLSAAWRVHAYAVLSIAVLQLALVLLPVLGLVVLLAKLGTGVTKGVMRRRRHAGTVPLPHADATKGITFATRRHGFDRGEVRAFVAAVADGMEQKERSLRQVREELDEERNKVTGACTELGAHVGSVFATALQEARLIREAAEADAAVIRGTAEQERLALLESLNLRREALEREHAQRLASLEARTQELQAADIILRRQLEHARHEITALLGTVGSAPVPEPPASQNGAPLQQPGEKKRPQPGGARDAAGDRPPRHPAQTDREMWRKSSSHSPRPNTAKGGRRKGRRRR